MPSPGSTTAAARSGLLTVAVRRLLATVSNHGVTPCSSTAGISGHCDADTIARSHWCPPIWWPRRSRARTPGLAFVAVRTDHDPARLSTASSSVSSEYSEFVHARDQLVGLGGCGVFMAYAAYVLAGEPAHEEAHPYYQAPYAFVKRNMEVGAGWWPGRHCQYFEFNCQPYTP